MSTPLAELRALNVKKQREAQTDTAEETDKPNSQSYDNMTGHMTNQQEDKPVSLPERLPTDQSATKTVRKQAAKPTAPFSVVQTIKATVQQGGDGAPALKTVTIKLAPTLDRRVEEHCFATGRKKQDVVRDALLLYFEAVEAIERGEA
jgi:preprotein translocase subunit Sec63